MAENPSAYEMFGTQQMSLNQITRGQRSNERLKETGFIFLRELCGTAVFTCIASMSHTNLLSAGLIYTALQASSEISSSGGLHLNPVISLAATIAGKMTTPILVIPMIIGQFVGALLGAGLCMGSQTKDQFLEDIYPYNNPEYYEIYKVEDKNLYRYCFGEFLLTCVLVMVFLHLFPLRTPSLPVTKEGTRDYRNRKYIHAIFVGLTICALTGAIYPTRYVGLMNPFRAFGPMVAWVAMKAENDELFKELFKGHWVYWVGPVIAGVVVGIVERIIGYFRSRNAE